MNMDMIYPEKILKKLMILGKMLLGKVGLTM